MLKKCLSRWGDSRWGDSSGGISRRGRRPGVGSGFLLGPRLCGVGLREAEVWITLQRP
jgi:hypothetical protein